MDVTETWDIQVEETNTLFKTFETDNNKYTGITNVQVFEIIDNKEHKFTSINEFMYHVTKNCYYGMINKNGDFEIAWGIGMDNSSDTKKYKISYTVKDVIEKYSDYAQLYWQFIGEEFEIDAKRIKGTISLPINANNKSEIKVWGHTEDLNGEIYVIDLNKIEFEVKGFNSGRYVEIRTLFPSDMITASLKEENKAILDEVIQEETIWANEANARRENKEFINKIILTILNIVFALVSVKLVFDIGKKVRNIKQLKKFKPNENIIYYRDIPRENATPAEAVYMYNKIMTDLPSTYIGRIFSATLLELSLKKVIEFEVTKEKNNKDIINIKLLNKNILLESEDEKAIFEFLKQAFKEKESITIKELKKFIEKSSSKVISLQDKINKGVKLGLSKNKLIDDEAKKEYQNKQIAQIGYIIAIIITIIIGCMFIQGINIYLLIGAIVLLTIQFILSTIYVCKINVFTQEGVNESEKWKGLKKYMQEFSMLDKREIPEIIIWEKFLVYATAFGIADKVLKQLRIIYPNIENSIDINTYTYMYLMLNTDFSKSFSNSINTSMLSAYSSATGSGGGFSGGGGFGGGRRRWRGKINTP